jgi:hypothetical protein
MEQNKKLQAAAFQHAESNIKCESAHSELDAAFANSFKCGALYQKDLDNLVLKALQDLVQAIEHPITAENSTSYYTNLANKTNLAKEEIIKAGGAI